MVSEQSNRKPYGEKRKIPDGEIRAAVKPELSEQQPEELQPQESLKRLTVELEITGESELFIAWRGFQKVTRRAYILMTASIRSSEWRRSGNSTPGG